MLATDQVTRRVTCGLVWRSSFDAMGVTIAFCDRFKVEELGSDELHRGGMGFEYVSRRSNVRFARTGSKNQSGPVFAHIGEALKGFLDGKGRPEFLDAFGQAAQDVAKRTELLLGLGKRPLNVELSSWAPAKGETIAVLVSLHPQRGLVDEISHFFRLSIQILAWCSFLSW
jgi:hypothetical protein